MKEIRPLRHRCANKEPSIGSAKDGQSFRRGSPSLYEPLCRAKEVVKSSLPVAPLGCVVPFKAEFGSSADIGQCKQASSFHKKSDKDAELRGHGHTAPPVGCHDRWARAAAKHVLAAHQHHRNSRAVLSREPNLSVSVHGRIERNASFCPERPSAGSLRVPKNADWLCQRFCFHEHLISFMTASNQTNGLVRANGHHSGLSA